MMDEKGKHFAFILTKTYFRFATPTIASSIPSLHVHARVLKIPSSHIEYNPNKDELGEGAQGTAFKAKWKTTDVVFKKLKRHKNEAEREAFLNELTVWRCCFDSFISILCRSNV
jgi:hypothetical protein